MWHHRWAESRERWQPSSAKRDKFNETWRQKQSLVRENRGVEVRGQRSTWKKQTTKKNSMKQLKKVSYLPSKSSFFLIKNKHSASSFLKVQFCCFSLFYLIYILRTSAFTQTLRTLEEAEQMRFLIASCSRISDVTLRLSIIWTLSFFASVCFRGDIQTKSTAVTTAKPTSSMATFGMRFLPEPSSCGRISMKVM